MKIELSTAPVLGLPDLHTTYLLDTDASDMGVGAAFSQIQERVEPVIACYNKTLALPERNDCITRNELLAVVKAVKHFKPHLYDQQFQLRTYHASL